MALERLHRDADVEIKVGNPYNASQIEDIIVSNRWPMVECKVCGAMHAASIRKLLDSMEGSEFEFCEPDCPKASAEKQGE